MSRSAEPLAQRWLYWTALSQAQPGQEILPTV